MTASIQWDDNAALNYTRFLQSAPAIARQEMTAGVQEVLLLLEREIKEKTPAGVSEALRGSITHVLDATPVSIGAGVGGKVFTPLNYALPVELGSKPHWPPVAALKDWVHHKLGVPQSEAGTVAFLIARKISKTGTKGAHMFERTLSEQSAHAVEILGQAVDRIRARLEGGQ